ncbi:MAG: zinc metallopeptidase [Spirochaetaceae bacterium]|jgi:Zn-dependent membrane protease YugP|nr:zinc metallopeptidase [Spirochaetaceae bacterium]
MLKRCQPRAGAGKEDSVYIDHYYIILVLPALLFSLIAQGMVTSAFSKYSKITNSKNITGSDAARILMQQSRISDVKIEAVQGSLSDHYDPSHKVLRLSEPVYGRPSIAAVGVAAHETGHAIQHAKGYAPLGLRSALVPAAQLGSSLGPALAVLGLIVSLPALFNLGIILFTAAVGFTLITLPVEFNASSRAIAILRDGKVLSEEELAGVKKVLTAAALTYVAAALSAIANLLRLVLLSRNRRRR